MRERIAAVTLGELAGRLERNEMNVQVGTDVGSCVSKSIRR